MQKKMFSSNAIYRDLIEQNAKEKKKGCSVQVSNLRPSAC
jgi:hypothetical protein